ncbi:DNA-binding MarR family transcriptional regulator [Paraburkholderia sp. GAS448]|uniref:MarR family winged helix-turn-helix transcriptional regulator n=1 Tax=Paraburkholderia sp. GAS448 TaxID=3035136 RepID=UPI003D24F474
MTTTGPTPDESLTYRLKALNKIAERMSSELSRGKIGLSMPEATIVGVLGAFGPQTIMDIARRSNLDKSQASRTSETLIGKGLLSRTASDQDGRSVIISLTPEGRKIFRKIVPMVEKRDKELYKCLSEPEMDALRYLLDKLLEAHGWQPE